MIDENQKRQPVDGEVNHELISTITATVLQTLQTTVENKDDKKIRSESKTVDLMGMFFRILEKFWIVLIGAVMCAVLMGMIAGNSVTTYSATAKLYIVNKDNSGVNIADLQLGTVLTLDYRHHLVKGV